MGFITNNNQSSSSSNQLKTLNDCYITIPEDAQQLVYDGNINRWTNKTGSSSNSALSIYMSMSDENTTIFNTQTVETNSRYFDGAVCDGRYIYFAPRNGYGEITRYDTTLSFTDAGSYSIFKLITLNPNANNYVGCVFDGRYIYFVPYNNFIFARYDTTLSFTDNNSYTFLDGTNIHLQCKGFHYAVFDGRYVYFVPQFRWDTLGYSGLLLRYDTTLSFTDASSYIIYDLALINASSNGFIGGVFDGRYIYLSPFPLGQVTRYDTKLSFNDAGSYAFYDISLLNANSIGFIGSVYDGRYVYFIPNNKTILTRYDTTLSFTDSGSYSFFDTISLGPKCKGFWGCVFDETYLYLIPSTYGTVVRYDTRFSFTTVSSYASFDSTTVSTSLMGFHSGVFYGKYIYFAPYSSNSGIIPRIDTSKIDGSKRFEFDLVGKTNNTKNIVTIPIEPNFVRVGDCVTQTLTNKTLDDTSNTITCDNLRTSTSKISIKSSTIPTAGQTLIVNDNATLAITNHQLHY